MNPHHHTIHPFYADEQKVGVVTDELIMAGNTVFQIFQMPENEWDHSCWLLACADPQGECRHTLSLGCGVGGMEAYWGRLRPRMAFELVNTSQAQLDRCVCQGKKVCADAETYLSANTPFDLVVLCYLLGHVQVTKTLAAAYENLAPFGRMLIYDVFEGSEQFREKLQYDTPSLDEVERFGVDAKMRFRTVTQGQIPVGAFFQDHFPWVVNQATPALFVFERTV